MVTILAEYTKDEKTPINNKLNVNVQDSLGNTAMHYAVIFDNLELVKYLVEILGADPF